MVAWIDLMSMWVVDPLIWTTGPLGTPRVTPSFSDVNRIRQYSGTALLLLSAISANKLKSLLHYFVNTLCPNILIFYKTAGFQTSSLA